MRNATNPIFGRCARGSRTVVVFAAALLAVAAIVLASLTLQATPAFAQEEETYTLNVSATGGGKVTGPGIDCGNGGTDCTKTYNMTYKRECTGLGECEFVPVPQEVTLTASTPTGLRFLGWGGACSGSGIQSTCTLFMAEDYSASAIWGKSYENGKIAFTKQYFGGTGCTEEAYIMNQDGTSKSIGGGLRDAEFSPDASKIAFSQNGNIHVMNVNGSGRTQLTSAGGSWPSFSPDGQKIAFVSNRDDIHGEIYTMNANGTGTPTRLTNYNLLDGAPDWSPDGTKIVFERQIGNREIHVMNADGTGDPTRLTTNAVHDTGPAYSPDGQKIAFASQPTSTAENDIYEMNTNGTGTPTRLTDHPESDSSPEYAPDGTKIAFSSNRDGNGEVYTMNVNGSDQTRRTNTTGSSLPQFDTPSSWGALNTTVAETTLDSSGPSDLVNTRSATFVFSSEPGSIFECKLDTGSFAACSSPRAYNNLSDGSHTFQVRAISAAGNVGDPKSRTWTVDATPPNVTITSGPTGTVNSASATFNFTASDATPGVSVECGVDDGNFAACDSFDNGSGQHSVAGRPDGKHTFRVEATDTAGNTRTASQTWTVDLTGPNVIGTTPDHGETSVAEGDDVTATFSEGMDPTTLGGTNFVLTKQGATSPLNAAVSYDDASQKATLNPNVDLDSTTTYVATVRGGSAGAKDRVGNPLATDKTWSFTTKDSRSPSVRLTRPADGATVGGTSVQLSAEATDNVGVRRVEFFVNNDRVGSDSTTPYAVNWNPATIPNGRQAKIKAIAVDTSNNRKTSATRTVTVDTAAPTVKTWTPTGKTVAPTANPIVTFSEAMNKSSVEARKNGKPTTFVLKQGTTVLAASVSYVETAKGVYKATLTPAKALKRGATYNVTVTKAAKDKVGNALVPKSWKFTVKK